MIEDSFTASGTVRSRHPPDSSDEQEIPLSFETCVQFFVRVFCVHFFAAYATGHLLLFLMGAASAIGLVAQFATTILEISVTVQWRILSKYN